MAVHQSFTAGLDTKQYEAGLRRLGSETSKQARMVTNEWARVQKATDAMMAGGGAGGGRKNFGKGYLVGGIAMQAQDVAVQLGAGTSAARVIAQQGSQIASYFGPKGMILGGVVAITAAMWEMSSAAEKAKKQAAETAKIVERMEKMKQLSQKADEDIADAATGPRLAAAAATGGERAVIEARKNMRDEEIRAGDVTQQVMRKQLEASEAKRDAELDTLRINANLANMKRKEAKEEADAERLASARAAHSEEVLSNEQKLANVNSTIAGLQKLSKRSNEEKAILVENMTKQAQLQKAIDEERNRAADKRKAEADKAAAAARTIGDEIARQMENLDKAREIEKEITAEREKQKRMKDYEAGERTLAGARELAKPAAQRAQERRQRREDARNLRRQADREVEEMDKVRDAAGRITGRRGMTAAQRKEQREAIIARAKRAQEKDKIEAKFSPDQIQKLTQAIEKLLTK